MYIPTVLEHPFKVSNSITLKLITALMDAETPVEAIKNSQDRMADVLEYSQRIGYLQGQVVFIQRIVEDIDTDANKDVQAKVNSLCEELIDELDSWQEIGVGFMQSEQKMQMLYSMVNVFTSDMEEVEEHFPDQASDMGDSFEGFMSKASETLEGVEFEIDVLYQTAMNIETLDPSTDDQDGETTDTIELLEEIERQREPRQQKVREMGENPPLSEISIEELDISR